MGGGGEKFLSSRVGHLYPTLHPLFWGTPVDDINPALP